MSPTSRASIASEAHPGRSPAQADIPRNGGEKPSGGQQAVPQGQLPSRKLIPNGGFEAWFSVGAVFCVFVNTW